MKGVIRGTSTTQLLVSSTASHLTVSQLSSAVSEKGWTKSECQLLSQIPMASECRVLALLEPSTFATFGFDKRLRIWRLTSKAQDKDTPASMAQLAQPTPAPVISTSQLQSKTEGAEETKGEVKQPGSPELVSLLYSCAFPKKLTCGTWGTLSTGQEVCMMADKYGDVYLVDIARAIASHNVDDKLIRQDFINVAEPAVVAPVCKFAMGHQEEIVHVLLNESKEFLVTIDKAFKIKVSQVPAFYHIHAVLFGHHADIQFAFFLSCYELLTLDSASHLILWDITKDDNAVIWSAVLSPGGKVVDAFKLDSTHVCVVRDDTSVTVCEINKASKDIKESSQIVFSDYCNASYVSVQQPLLSDSKHNVTFLATCRQSSAQALITRAL